MSGLKLHPGGDDSDKVGGGCVVLFLIGILMLFALTVKIVELEHNKSMSVVKEVGK